MKQKKKIKKNRKVKVVNFLIEAEIGTEWVKPFVGQTYYTGQWFSQKLVYFYHNTGHLGSYIGKNVFFSHEDIYLNAAKPIIIIIGSIPAKWNEINQ